MHFKTKKDGSSLLAAFRIRGSSQPNHRNNNVQKPSPDDMQEHPISGMGTNT